MTSESKPPHVAIDTVRASRDGHSFHEIWAARVALELLHPTSTLRILTIEGFSTEDESSVSGAATEIADIVRYRGGINRETATSIEVLQFKYSVARANQDVRAFDIKKTLQKFAVTDADFTSKIGFDHVEAVVRYEIVTNRPISPVLMAAVQAIRNGQTLQGEEGKQAQYIKNALPDLGDKLPAFLRRVSLNGSQGTLLAVHGTVRRTLADWTAPNDPLTRVRLDNLRNLVRDKAGSKGQANNEIDRVALLACLEVDDEAYLFPAPDAFPTIPAIVERPAVADLLAQTNQVGHPWLVDAAGGMGKTVLMQSLGQRLAPDNAVVLFDCFGGGAWRNPADGRHLPEKALPHIVNLLAVQGLCDILIPGVQGPDLVRAFRQRLEHAVKSLRHSRKDASIVLLLDAIDNAAQQAISTRTESFAHILLQTLSLVPIEGVLAVASCRTERRDMARGQAACRRFELPPFSEGEIAAIARANQNDVTATEIADLSARCDGNPRVLVALLAAGRPYHAHAIEVAKEPGETLLDKLIWERFEKAINEAMGRGSTEAELHRMLAALAMLPPPVPVAELAAAQGLTEAAVKSFASDLSPLLAYSQHELVFADEPTETLVQRRVQDDMASREAVVQRLMARQEESNYAARALPSVLSSLRKTDDLVQLAFQDRLPRSATSRVAQRAIRLSRLSSALISCAQEQRTDDLTRLLVEASRVAGGNERSDRFLQDHPDLVAIADDPEALRRLLEIRTGWPGRRHAALSVAFALTDDPDEARRHSWRAFDWLNWRATQTEEPGARKLPNVGDLDRFGPAYWAILGGRASRVISWIDQWREDYAFNLLSHLVSLLERHATISEKANSAKEFLLRQACRCRVKSRPLYAALLNHASLAADQSARLIRRLAHVSATASPVPQEWSHDQNRFLLADALLAAAIKAVRVGMTEEARLIVDGIGLRRPRVSEFDGDVWVSETIQPFLLANCIRAAIDGRSPSLMDLCPEEVDGQIKRPSARKNAASFDKAVEAFLKPRKLNRKRRANQKTAFDNSARESALRTLAHRIRPLLPHAAAVTSLIRSSSIDTETTAALDLLTKDVSVRESYPYRDRPRYIATVCFPLLFKTVDALGLLPETTAAGLANWLVNSPIGHHQNKMYVAGRFARRPPTRDAALTLARNIADGIAAETDTSMQINLYGALARAIWPASKSEAKAYFRRGLEVADALGSDNHEKIIELLSFAAQYSGDPLSPSVAHSLATICELNLPEESEKFDWVTYGRAMSRICGPGALANVARLADRRKVDLSYSLPPLLTALAKDNRLAPDLAGALIGVDEPVETWSWMLADLLEATLPRLSSPQCEDAVGFVLSEIDRQYRGDPPRESIERITELATKYLPDHSLSRERLGTLQPEIAPQSAPSTSTEAVSPLGLADPPVPDAVLAGIDVTNPDAIDGLLQIEDNNEPGRRWPVRVLESLAQPIRSVDQRCRFLRAIAETQIPSLIDKLTVLNNLVPDWGKRSAAVTDILPELARQLAVRHAAELIESDWDSSYTLRSLIRFSNQAGHELIPIIITALRDRMPLVPSTVWLKLATALASAASAAAIKSALERFLSKSAEDLPESVGDGPWTTKLLTPTTESEIVAGLIWQRLGSPVAAERWRAAHALRRLVQTGRRDVLSFVVAHLDSKDAGPFQDQSLPFFYLHARLWLYITLARVAADSPDVIKEFKGLLKSAAFDSTFPHVLIRHFAGKALASMAPVLALNERAGLLDALSRLNVSPLPRAKESQINQSPLHEARPPEHPESENPFHYDYDFIKYQLDHVARLFALPLWRIEDECTKWVKAWSPDAQNMYSCPRIKPHYGDGVGDWSAVSIPAHDLWGGHLAWHALMLSVGKFLPTTPIVGYSWDETPWEDWLSGEDLSSPKGLWLADGTDRFPPDIRRTLSPVDAKNDGVPNDPTVFAEIIGLSSESALRETLVVDGFWRAKDSIDVSVQSVLVDDSEAMNVALTIALADPFYRWIPDEDNHGLTNEQSLTAKLIRPWTSSPGDSSLQLDRHDPYSASTALHRPRPIQEFVQKYDLKADGPFCRTWSLDGSDIFMAEAWGSKRGTGKYETEHHGSRLSCRSDFLKQVLVAEKAQLVLLVKAQKHLEKTEKDGSGTFRTETLTALLCPKRGVRVIRRIPRVARIAVAALSKYDRSFFETRLVAIRRALAS